MFATTDTTNITYLVKQAQEGNIRAFEILVEHFERDIFVFLVCRLHNHEDADDLAQQVFLKAWRNLGTLHDAACFKPWLQSISKRLLCDHWRQKRFCFQSWESLVREDQTLEIAGPEESAMIAELIELTLSRMSPKLRLCFRLHDFDGLLASEIAVKVHICEASVGTYVSSARKQFREIYQQLEDEYEEYIVVQPVRV